jgi:hypothetical protein
LESRNAHRTIPSNYPLAYHCHIVNQHLAPVFRGKNKMIRQQRHRMPVVTQFFPVHITTIALTGSSTHINKRQAARKYFCQLEQTETGDDPYQIKHKVYLMHKDNNIIYDTSEIHY